MRTNPVASRRGHARSRARERFGLEIGKAARLALIDQVRSRQFKFAKKVSHSRTVVVTDHNGIEVTFIYSNTRKDIVTFLPAGSRETAEFHNQKARHCVNSHFSAGATHVADTERETDALTRGSRYV